MATGAGDGEPEEGLGDDVDLVVHVLYLFVRGIERLEAMFDQAEVARADGGFVDTFLGIHAGLLQEIARELLAHELIVRYIPIEGPDQVVAITPRLDDLRIAFAAAGIGVADEVHPMASEVFAITLGGQ